MPLRMPAISKGDWQTAGCGLLMGAADIVPGVSGGTVALILGIYNRLVTAISRIDRETAGLVLERRWNDAARRIDLRFLAGLFCGIGCGIAGLSFVMHYLLLHQLQFTFAVFSGLILGSGVLVARSIRRPGPGPLAAIVSGAAAAWVVVELDAVQHPPDTLWYLFACGVIGICAMILPGISGSFILLILGRYDHVTGLVRSLLRGAVHLNLPSQTLIETAVFGAGCVCGLLTASRGLHWLLHRHPDLTLATLCGFMLGSLRRIWPFKIDHTPAETSLKAKELENVLPDQLDGTTLATIALALGALAAVLILEALSRRVRSA